MLFLGRTGRLMSLKVSLAQKFFCFKISKASVPEAHTRIRNIGRTNRKEQEKDYDRLLGASWERWKRSVSKTRACVINKNTKRPKSRNGNTCYKFGNILYKEIGITVNKRTD